MAEEYKKLAEIMEKIGLGMDITDEELDQWFNASDDAKKIAASSFQLTSKNIAKQQYDEDIERIKASLNPASKNR